MCLALYVVFLFWSKKILACVEAVVESWMTIKKTDISAQHEFRKPIYLYVYRVTILKYLDVQREMLAYVV